MHGLFVTWIRHTRVIFMLLAKSSIQETSNLHIILFRGHVKTDVHNLSWSPSCMLLQVIKSARIIWFSHLHHCIKRAYEHAIKKGGLPFMPWIFLLLLHKFLHDSILLGKNLVHRITKSRLIRTSAKTAWNTLYILCLFKVQGLHFLTGFPQP